jgi:trehalose 6-phosphate phosphatase
MLRRNKFFIRFRSAVQFISTKLADGLRIASALGTGRAMTDSLAAPPPLHPDDALFLDFDGTLVELTDRPDAIDVPERLPHLIARVADRLQGRVGIVSGRSIADLERHAGPVAVALSGSHGIELRLPGRKDEPLDLPEGLDTARAEVARFAAAAESLLVEDKTAGIAVHYRQAPGEESRVAEFMAALAERTGLRLQRGKMVAELLPPGGDKGAAVRRIMAEPAFAAARPLFVGDDLTDEHAFEAAAALGGGGILVGPPRETAARWRLDGVPAVIAWLEAAAA